MNFWEFIKKHEFLVIISCNLQKFAFVTWLMKELQDDVNGRLHESVVVNEQERRRNKVHEMVMCCLPIGEMKLFAKERERNGIFCSNQQKMRQCK